MTLPMVVPDPSLPGRVTIWEVGPRDGLQNESCVIDTQTKIEFIDRLSATGLGIVEATSFVRPDRVPQLADAREVMAGITRRGGVRYPVLVPNLRGLESAIDAGVSDIAIFASATESFAQRNLGRGYDAQWEMFEPVTTRARADGLRTRGYLSMCFGDPWEGAVPAEQVVTAALRLQDLGCDEISLGDTIGVATPGQVGDLVRRLVAAGVPLEGIGVHFHDTYGQALANTLAALREGVTTVDASAGGLGGCPYAVSATGNLATEDLVYMLDGLGISHGVDLAALIDTTHWLEDHLGRPSPSRVVRARTPQKEQ
jgi:hydroxymethylglutaryl-CoA lyase